MRTVVGRSGCISRATRERACRRRSLRVSPSTSSGSRSLCRHALRRQSAEGRGRQVARHRAADAAARGADARRRRRRACRDLPASARSLRGTASHRRGRPPTRPRSSASPTPIATFYRGRLTSIAAVRRADRGGRRRARSCTSRARRERHDRDATAEAPTQRWRRRGGARARERLLRTALVAAVVACRVIVAVALTPNFLTVDNIRAILRNAVDRRHRRRRDDADDAVGQLRLARHHTVGDGGAWSVRRAGRAGGPPVLAIARRRWPALVLGGVLQGIVVAAGLNPVITTLAAGAIIFGVVADATNGGIVRVGAHSGRRGATPRSPGSRSRCSCSRCSPRR